MMEDVDGAEKKQKGPNECNMLMLQRNKKTAQNKCSGDPKSMFGRANRNLPI